MIKRSTIKGFLAAAALAFGVQAQAVDITGAGATFPLPTPCAGTGPYGWVDFGGRGAGATFPLTPCAGTGPYGWVDFGGRSRPSPEIRTLSELPPLLTRADASIR